jgi:hypothetical protein
MQADLAIAKLPLRLGMESVVPSRVIWRKAKGSQLNSRIAWAIGKRAGLLLSMLKEPLLADLGCIEPKPLIAAVQELASGGGTDEGLLQVYNALSLETWLRVRVHGALPMA